MGPLIIVNPTAGRGRALKALPRFRDIVAQQDPQPEVRLSTCPEDPARWAKEAAEKARPVYAFGGDGLVHQIVNAVADKVPCGVLPAGSGNDFARALGLPLDPIRAWEAIRKGGNTRRVDLGHVTGPQGQTRLFCAVASTGFDSTVNEIANRKGGPGGTLRYLSATLTGLRSWKPTSFQLELTKAPEATTSEIPSPHDKGKRGKNHEKTPRQLQEAEVAEGAEVAETITEEMTGWMVTVGNSSSYGGGMRVCPHAELDDGLLDVTLVGDVSRPVFLRVFPLVFTGRHVRHAKVRSLRVQRLCVAADRPLTCFVDGEEVCPLPVTFQVMPQALDVLVP